VYAARTGTIRAKYTTSRSPLIIWCLRIPAPGPQVRIAACLRGFGTGDIHPCKIPMEYLIQVFSRINFNFIFRPVGEILSQYPGSVAGWDLPPYQPLSCSSDEDAPRNHGSPVLHGGGKRVMEIEWE